MTIRRFATATAVVVALTAALAACAPTPEPVATPTATPTISAPEPTPSEPPTLDADGNAHQNLDYFDYVNEQLIEAADSEPKGRDFVDSLVEAGFEKDTLEVTRDSTPIGLEADSVIFAARWGDQCLIGQYDGEGYHGVVADVLGTGDCLIGRTRPIDW